MQQIIFDMTEQTFKKLVKEYWQIGDPLLLAHLKNRCQAVFHEDYLLPKRPSLEKSFRESMQEAGYDVFSGR